MLKLIAMITMAADHIGLIFFPQNDAWRIVGRIAFPLYAYAITEGYMHTKNLPAYGSRLIAMALFCHLPILFGVELSVYNVIFTLLAGLLAIVLLDESGPFWQKIPSLTVIIYCATMIPIDYGLYGVLTIVMYHYLRRYLLIVGHIVLNLLFVNTFAIGWIQWFSLLATFLILVQTYLPDIKVNRTLYWWFYPAHLAFLYLLDSIIYDWIG